MRFRWLATLLVTLPSLQVAEDIRAREKRMVAGSLARLPVVALVTRPLHLLARCQLLDVALAELEHFPKPLILLPFEHLLAIVKDMARVLRQ